MKLYFNPGACSLSPHIALLEAGLAFTPVLADMKTHQLADGTDYYTINPKGYVPVLELDDGTRLTEGPAIVQYIADQVPDKQLAPPNGTLQRAQLQEWLNFITSELHKGFTPLFKPDTPDAYKPIARENLLKRLKWVDGQLADKPYLLGETFSVADGYLFVVANWGRHAGVDIRPFEHLGAFMKRVAARPTVQAALKAEGLTQ